MSQLKCFKKKNCIIATQLIFAMAILLFFGCGAPKFTLKFVETTPEIVKEDLNIQIDDSLTLDGFELKVNGYFKEYDYEPKLDKFLFSYGPKKDESDNKTFVLYDISTHEIDWIQEGNPTIDIFNEDVIIFRKGSDNKIYDIENGSYLRQAEGRLYLTGDGIAFILSSEKFSRIDIKTGKEIWKKPGYEWEGYRKQYLIDNWMYVMTEGIHAFNIENGEGWDFETSTYHKDHMKEMAKQCGLTLLAALGGGYNTAAYQPDITHNLFSNPLVIGDNIYFAARRNVFCFDKLNGEIIWQQELPEELGSMWIHKISDDRIALTGEGWKYINYQMNKALPPSFTIFNTSSGEIVAQFKTENSDFLLDSDFSLPEKYFLTSKCLYAFDSDYNLTVMLNNNDKYGNFLRLVDTEEVLVVRTEMGVLSLDKKSLEEIWFVDLGWLPMENKETLKNNWTFPFIAWAYEDARSWSSDILDWFPSIEGIIALDIYNNGQIVKEIPISGDNYFITDNGDLISMFEGSLMYILLK